MKIHNARKSSGATVVLVAIVTFFVLLPLGLLAFEVSRLFLAQSQLQNAVDAAALSAIVGGQDPNIPPTKIKDYAFRQFQLNNVTGVSLASNSSDTAPVAADQKAGQAAFDLKIDPTNDQATVSAAFGLQAAFGDFKFLPIGTVTIRANSVAGHRELIPNEVAIVVDISDSIKGGCGVNEQSFNGASSKSLATATHANLASEVAKGNCPKYSYTRVVKNSRSGPKTVPVKPAMTYAPAGLHLGGNFVHQVPDPDQVFNTIDPEHPLPARFQKFLTQVNNLPAADKREAEVAFLAAAKQGWLDTATPAASNHAHDTILGSSNFFGAPAVPAHGNHPAIPAVPGSPNCMAGPGYQADYEQVALPFVHPLVDEKRDVRKMVAVLRDKNPAVKIALVGFAPKAGGHLTAGRHGAPPSFGPELGDVPPLGKNGYGTSGKNTDRRHPDAGFEIPFIQLGNGESGGDHDEVSDSIDVATTALGTNTADGLHTAHEVLTRGDHNLTAGPQLCLLFTDGIPTSGGYIQQAKTFGKDGIPIAVIGYSQIGYSHGGGPRVCGQIANHGGLGSHYVAAPFKQDPNGRTKFDGYYIPGTRGPKLDPSNESDKRLKHIFDGPAVLLNK